VAWLVSSGVPQLHRLHASPADFIHTEEVSMVSSQPTQGLPIVEKAA
jgi:hypothetical protein